jgi:hypothetical protein
MITDKEIANLKAFGYNVFEVTDRKTGTHCFEYKGNVSVININCPSYVAHKGEQKAWEAVLKFHKRSFTIEIAKLQEEIDEAFWNWRKIQKKNQALMKKIKVAKKQQIA